MFVHLQRALPVLCLSVLNTAVAMTPADPVENFRLPRFNDEGFTEWVLQGGRGFYDSEEKIRVRDMVLRLYSGDERMARELTLESPFATILLEENRAHSDESIRIEGRGFAISGVGWRWQGANKAIEIANRTEVSFRRAIAGDLGTGAALDGEGRPEGTEVRSKRLVLETSPGEYRFLFRDEVAVRTRSMDLTGDRLLAIADVAREGAKEGAVPAVGEARLDAFRRLMASGSVVIRSSGRTVRSGRAEFFPREEVVHLRGDPEIEVPGAFLSGRTARSREGELVLKGGGDSGRAQMILIGAGGLGLGGVSETDSETVLLADSITLLEREETNEFVFEDSVEVMSGALQMTAGKMSVFSDKKSDGERSASSGEDPRIGRVRRIVAEEQVEIDRGGRVGLADTAVFFPVEEKAELTGNPRIRMEGGEVSGPLIRLRPGSAWVGREGEDGGERVRVRLASLPDLGYTAFGGEASGEADTGEEDAAEEKQIEKRETTIRSDTLRVTEEAEKTVFRFKDSVEVSGTNLEATSRELEVTAVRRGDGGEAGDFAVERIEAFGDVEIRQKGRVSTAETARILPAEDSVVLEENVVVKQDGGRVTGERMTLNRGQRRITVEGGEGENDRARLTLPEMGDPDL